MLEDQLTMSMGKLVLFNWIERDQTRRFAAMVL
jgi:hypothetical protein